MTYMYMANSLYSPYIYILKVCSHSLNIFLLTAPSPLLHATTKLFHSFVCLISFCFLAFNLSFMFGHDFLEQNWEFDINSDISFFFGNFSWGRQGIKCHLHFVSFLLRPGSWKYINKYQVILNQGNSVDPSSHTIVNAVWQKKQVWPEWSKSRAITFNYI